MTITNGPGGDKAFSVKAVILYSRRDCYLCEVAKDVLEGVRKRTPFDLSIVDVDGDPDLRARFGTEVPVVFVDGRKAFKYRVDPARFEKRIREG
jgi:glutaredoxin